MTLSEIQMNNPSRIYVQFISLQRNVIKHDAKIQQQYSRIKICMYIYMYICLSKKLNEN